VRPRWRQGGTHLPYHHPRGVGVRRLRERHHVHPWTHQRIDTVGHQASQGRIPLRRRRR
jgi:hypothetical protein